MYVRVFRESMQDAEGLGGERGEERRRTGRERIERHISKRAVMKLTLDSESSSSGIWVDSR